MTTYDPVKAVERPKVGMFSGLPSAPPGTVLVVDREGHDVRVLDRPGDRLTAGEVRWGQIRTLYEVDVTEHAMEFTETLPCQDDIGGFRAIVKYTCVVRDAAAVVRRGIHDVARVLEPLLTETMRRTASAFAAEAYDQAETAALSAVRGIESEGGHDPAFAVSRVHLTLSLDGAAASFVHERKEATRNLVRQQDAAMLEREKSNLEAELTRARDQHEAERSKLTAEFEQERLLMQRARERLESTLEDQRQQLDLERARAKALAEQQTSSSVELGRLDFEEVRQLKQAALDAAQLRLGLEQAQLRAALEKHELEAKLDRDRVQVTAISDLLARGEWSALALQLAQNPESIGQINDRLAQQKHVETNRQIQLLQLMLESDGLEGYQITDQAKAVLHRLVETWSAKGGELPAGRSGGGNEPPVVDVRAEAAAVEAELDDDEYPGDRITPSSSGPEPARP